MNRLDKIEKILERLALSSEKYKLKNEKYKLESEKEFRELRKSQKQTTEFQKQTNKKFEEIAEFQKQTTENINKLSKNFGSFTNNQGDIIEILFFNALKEHLILDNIKYNFIALNEERMSENTEQEFDIVLVNSSQVALIEVKGKAHEKDIEKLDKIVESYKLLFPEHKHYKLQSYLGSLHFNKKIKEDIKETNHKLLLLKGNAIQVL